MCWIELERVNFSESGSFVGGEAIEKPALCALRALLKARTFSVQLWESGRFREIIHALLRPFTPFLPPSGPFEGEPEALATVLLRLSVLSIREPMSRW